MPPLFGSAPDNSIDDLKKQINQLQSQLEAQTQAQIQTGRVLQNTLNQTEKEEILFKWKAPERIFIRRDKQWYWTAALIALIFTIILLIFGEPILVGAVFSVLFVLYVSSTVPPAMIEHSISNLGMRTSGNLYTWEQLEDFWFSYRLNKEILNIDTKLPSPQRLIFFFSKKDKEKLVEILKIKLPYRNAPQSQGWVSKNSEGVYITLDDIESSVNFDKQYEKAT